MAAAQRGHADAYQRLLSEVRAWLMRFYGRRLPPSHIEDAVQDALLSMHEKRHTYDPSRPFRPWLGAIAKYKWIDRLRTMHRHFDPLSDDIGVPDHGSAVMSNTVLSLLLAELPLAQQEVIKLVKIEGLSVEEASERTGQSVSLVKVNIHRGLVKLAVIVQDYADAE